MKKKVTEAYESTKNIINKKIAKFKSPDKQVKEGTELSSKKDEKEEIALIMPNQIREQENIEREDIEEKENEQAEGDLQENQIEIRYNEEEEENKYNDEGLKNQGKDVDEGKVIINSIKNCCFT